MRAPATRRLSALARRVRREERGQTLVELLVTLAILGTITASVSVLFESGFHAQSNLDTRFQAQVQLNTALVKLRREAHNACGLAYGYTTSSITLDMPTGNPPPQPPDTPCTAPTTVTWCTIGSGTRYALYRVAGTTCTATNAHRYADFITNGAVFTGYTAVDLADSTLAQLHVQFPVNVSPGTPSSPTYTLDDEIVLRNSA